MPTTDHIANRTGTWDKLDILEEHIHNPSMCYPTLANGVAVLGGGAWALGSFVEIVPINTITKDFDIHFISVENLSVVEVYEIKLYVETTLIGCVRVVRSANQDSTTQVPIQTPILKANSQVQAKVATEGGSDTATISLHYHTY